ncbi:MAG: phosphoenolpyruvate carboxylase [Adlercreutzia sp.]
MQGIPKPTPGARAFRETVELIDALPVDQAQVVVRAFTSFFHLANLSERTTAWKRCASWSATCRWVGRHINELVAYGIGGRVGPERTAELLGRLEFHPVFTRHEARRKAVGQDPPYRRVAGRASLPGRIGPLENERHMLQEIDALVRTSPTIQSPRPWKRPTPSSTSSTTRCSIPCRRCTGVSTTGCWARTPAACRPCARRSSVRQLDRSDRDGNERHRGVAPRGGEVLAHMVAKLAQECRSIGRNLTLESRYTAPSGL